VCSVNFCAKVQNYCKKKKPLNSAKEMGQGVVAQGRGTYITECTFLPGAKQNFGNFVNF
jgi:hypothetical protein